MPPRRKPHNQPPQGKPSLGQLAWAELGIPADYCAARGLPLQVQAAKLISIGTNPDGRDIQLSPAAGAAWLRMRESASRAGVALVAISGFRSIERQVEIIRAKLLSGQAIGDILKTVAAPGTSEHHTGRAIDIGTPGQEPLTEDFARTPAFRWLESHAGAFSFKLSYPRDNSHGISYEPWHWCFHPRN
jgi:D-alanyl-D-alanine carboxypeptidase